MLRKVARVRAGKNFRDSRVTFFEKFAIGRERGVLTILCGIGSCRIPRPSLADYVMGTGTTAGGGASVDYPRTFGTDRPVCNPSNEQCSQRGGRVEALVRASS